MLRVVTALLIGCIMGGPALARDPAPRTGDGLSLANMAFDAGTTLTDVRLQQTNKKRTSPGRALLITVGVTALAALMIWAVVSCTQAHDTVNRGLGPGGVDRVSDSDWYSALDTRSACRGY